MMNSNLESHLKSLKSSSIASIVLLIFILVILIGVYIVSFHKLSWGNPENFGQFGDYIGGLLNPVVAFLALYALWKTASVQTDMLKDQMQKELDRDAEDRSIAFRNEQNDLFKRDYESYLSIVNTIVYIRKGEVMSSGKAALYMLLNRDREFEELNRYLRENCENTNAEYSFKGLKNIVSNEPVRDNVFMNPVFRTVYQVLKDQARENYRSKENPKEYNQQTYENIRFFRAQLSGDELIFIALNILFTEAGEKGLSKYVQEFGLLKHLHIKQLRKYVEETHGAKCFGRGYAAKHVLQQAQP